MEFIALGYIIGVYITLGVLSSSPINPCVAISVPTNFRANTHLKRTNGPLSKTR